MIVKNKSAREILAEVKRLESEAAKYKDTDLIAAAVKKQEAYNLMKAWIAYLHPGIIT